jgi:hypothetical protein
MSEKAGSAIMRGQQVASMRDNWDYKFNPTYEEMVGYDIIVLVKKAKPSILADIRRTGAYFIYDALDWWGQDCMGETRGRQLSTAHFIPVNADKVIFTHYKYHEDCFRDCNSSIVIPHHGDPRLPIGTGKKNLVYYGEANYIGSWYIPIVRACAQNGWQFLINPSDKSCASAMISVRDAKHNSWINRNWKSQVKLANAELMGLQLFHTQQASLEEYATDDTFMFTSEEELTHMIGQSFKVAPNNRFSLKETAKQYEEMFNHCS